MAEQLTHPGRMLLVVTHGDGRTYRRRLWDVDERHPVFFDDAAGSWVRNPRFCGDPELDQEVLDFVKSGKLVVQEGFFLQ
ncbi:MAG: hypothetical protein ACREKR_12575 [Candidatus Methylomirabilales bacterium]